jgi:GTP-binding protein
LNEKIKNKKGLIFNQQTEHYTAASGVIHFPELNIPEVCFAGRSNVGKSSLINAICSKRGLARTSHTPGRTQLIHFYSVQDKLFLSDLPGYGYAKVSKSKTYEWTRLMEAYFKNRSNLSRVFILIDSRRGLKNSDHELMDLLNVVAVNFQLIFTKIDKISKNALKELYNDTINQIQKYAAAFPEIIGTSAHKKIGIDKIHECLNLITNIDNDSKKE